MHEVRDTGFETGLSTTLYGLRGEKYSCYCGESHTQH